MRLTPSTFVQSAALAAVLCLSGFAPPAVALPFVPRDDAEVVERLPLRLGSAEQRRQQRDARERLRHQPTQLPLALQLARESIERARQLGDPRELGQAEATLAPWWQLDQPPPAVRLLRATVRQSQHEFEAALSDLDALLRRDSTAPLPVQAQAELTRASVLQVQGRWSEAAAGCRRLAGERYAALGASVRLPALACQAELLSLQGQAGPAQAALDQLAREAPDERTAGWLSLVRAELAERRGDAAAGPLFQQALQAAGGDVYTLAAYADWLLSQRREREVVALLSARQEADALLLRLAIALKRSDDPRAGQAITTLAERFSAAALRGDRSHAREQARFSLDLQGNAAAALRHAQVNWAHQKEPADALILLRAAQAASQPEAAEPVWRLVRDTAWQDVRLHTKATP